MKFLKKETPNKDLEDPELPIIEEPTEEVPLSGYII